MASTYTLDEHLETFVQRQLESGRYEDASAIVRDALKLLEDRQRREETLIAAIARGLDDIDAGRLSDGDQVFDAMESRYREMARARSPA